MKTFNFFSFIRDLPIFNFFVFSFFIFFIDADMVIQKELEKELNGTESGDVTESQREKVRTYSFFAFIFSFFSIRLLFFFVVSFLPLFFSSSFSSLTFFLHLLLLCSILVYGYWLSIIFFFYFLPHSSFFCFYCFSFDLVLHFLT